MTNEYTSLIVYEVHWSNSYNWHNSVLGWDNSGLWDNAGLVSIHIPHFKKCFNLDSEYKNSFFISYKVDDKLVLDVMDFYYSSLNDIVFRNRVYLGLRKAHIYTTNNPIDLI